MMNRARPLLLIGVLLLATACCGPRAASRQIETPRGMTVQIKCRSDKKLCHNEAVLKCGSADYTVLTHSEESGGSCWPGLGFYTWYRLNVRC